MRALLLSLSFTALAALTACGADLGEACTSDDDCAGDLVCHTHEGEDEAACEEPDAHDDDEHDDHEDDTGA